MKYLLILFVLCLTSPTLFGQDFIGKTYEYSVVFTCRAYVQSFTFNNDSTFSSKVDIEPNIRTDYIKGYWSLSNDTIYITPKEFKETKYRKSNNPKGKMEHCKQRHYDKDTHPCNTETLYFANDTLYDWKSINGYSNPYCIKK